MSVVRCAVVALLSCCTLVAAAGDPTAPRRLFALLGGLQQEYAEAVDDGGRVVRARELSEARLLLGDLRELATRLGPTATDLGTGLDALATDVGSGATPAIVATRIASLRELVRHLTGAGEDLLPSQPPSAARGEAIFAADCAGCHDARGTGDGANAAGLATPPADFTDLDFLRDETPLDFFHVVSLGRRTAGMPAWDESLSLQERWDVVSYVWSLAIAPATLAAGANLFATHCASCHGTEHAPSLADLAASSARTDAERFGVVTNGVAPDRMPAFGDRLSDEERWQVVAFVRQRSLGVTGAGDPRPETPSGRLTRRLARVRRAVAGAVAAYRSADPDAAPRAAEAYLLFEPLEAAIAARDPSAVTRVEAAFDRFRTALGLPGASTEAEAAAAAVGRALDAVPLPDAPSGGVTPRLLLVGAAAVTTIALRQCGTRATSHTRPS